MIGDVDARALTAGQIDSLAEFVSKFGGAVVFIAGKQYDPSSYSGTPLAKAAPGGTGSIRWRPVRHGAGYDARPHRVRAGEPHAEAFPERGGERADLARVPAHPMDLPALPAPSPARKCSWRIPTPRRPLASAGCPRWPCNNTESGRFFSSARTTHGAGGRAPGSSYYPLLWGQIVQRMALAHLLGGSRRTQLSADKQRYNTGDRVTVFARLYDENFDPVRAPSANGFHTGGAGAPRQSVPMHPLPDQPGMYRGEFVAVAPGAYKFSVESDPATAVEFAVDKPRFELGETAMNEPLLKEMARISGGGFFREEDLATLPGKLSEKDERITRVIDAELWATPFYFLLVAGIVITEWVLRKRYELK